MYCTLKLCTIVCKDSIAHFIISSRFKLPIYFRDVPFKVEKSGCSAKGQMLRDNKGYHIFYRCFSSDISRAILVSINNICLDLKIPSGKKFKQTFLVVRDSIIFFAKGDFTVEYLSVYRDIVIGPTPEFYLNRYIIYRNRASRNRVYVSI